MLVRRRHHSALSSLVLSLQTELPGPGRDFILGERGVSISHTTILRWVVRYAETCEKRWSRFELIAIGDVGYVQMADMGPNCSSRSFRIGPR